MPTEQSDEFKKAVEESRQLKATPTDNELLQLYAHYKQGCQDPPIDEAEKPGTFDLKGKEKRKAWQKLHDKGESPEDAQAHYVELVEQAKEKYGFEGKKEDS